MKRRNPEIELQKAIVQFLRLARPDVLWFHCPNGGSRSVRTAAMLKSIGVRAGVPDLIFILPKGLFGAIEVKSTDGRLSLEQRAWRDAIKRSGGFWSECRSITELEGIINAWYGRCGVHQ